MDNMGPKSVTSDNRKLHAHLIDPCWKELVKWSKLENLSQIDGSKQSEKHSGTKWLKSESFIESYMVWCDTRGYFPNMQMYRIMMALA